MLTYFLGYIAGIDVCGKSRVKYTHPIAIYKWQNSSPSLKKMLSKTIMGKRLDRNKEHTKTWNKPVIYDSSPIKWKEIWVCVCVSVLCGKYKIHRRTYTRIRNVCRWHAHTYQLKYLILRFYSLPLFISSNLLSLFLFSLPIFIHILSFSTKTLFASADVHLFLSLPRSFISSFYQAFCFGFLLCVFFISHLLTPTVLLLFLSFPFFSQAKHTHS